MKIKINKEGKEIEVDCKNPKGRDVKKGFNNLIEMQKDEGNAEKVAEFMEFLDNMTAEHTGMSVDELDDLESDEKNKLVNHYYDKIHKRFDFLMPSQKLAN